MLWGLIGNAGGPDGNAGSGNNGAVNVDLLSSSAFNVFPGGFGLYFGTGCVTV